MAKIDKATKNLLIRLAGDEIEKRDKAKSWLPYKDRELETEEYFTRITAIKAYTKLTHLETYD